MRATKYQKRQTAIRDLLASLDLDVKGEHLCDTPKRVAEFYEEFLNPSDFSFTAFSNRPDLPFTHQGDGQPILVYDQIILQSNIPFYSMCAHHLLPFFGRAHVAYIPNARICGLSKLARLVDKHARQLTLQEKIGRSIADELEEVLDPLATAVMIDAEHMCMTMRGVNKPGTITSTSDMRGAFRDKPAARQELLAMIQRDVR